MRVHDQVILGTALVVVLAAIGGAVTVVGFPGTLAETTVTGALTQAHGAVERAFPSLETLVKLAGLAITLLSGTYAIYQKIYFAEFNMKTRLKEFQQREEQRLKHSNEHLARAVLRPGPVRDFESPIFTDEILNPVLKQMKWGKRPRADELLETSLKDLEEQLELWNVQKRTYELHKAQACLLKGAIAAARAAKAVDQRGEEAQKDDVESLEYFREAFQLSNDSDVEALEYVGHQEVRLGDHNAALATFQRLANMAPPGKSLLRARALKFQAAIYECRTPPNLGRANSTLIEAEEALPDDASHIERAEIHEMHGKVREKLRAFNVATHSYRKAEFWYLRTVRRGSDGEGEPVKHGAERMREAAYRIQMKLLTQGDDGDVESANSADLSPESKQDVALVHPKTN